MIGPGMASTARHLGAHLLMTYLMEEKPGRKLRRRERREDRHKADLVRAKDKSRRKTLEKGEASIVDKSELQHLQEMDEILAAMRAEAGEPTKIEIFWGDGVLYK